MGATGTAAATPGWFADPDDPTRWRWWDGSGWTEHRG
jgi:resuscitation-promoting factor RpfB